MFYIVLILQQQFVVVIHVIVNLLKNVFDNIKYTVIELIE